MPLQPEYDKNGAYVDNSDRYFWAIKKVSSYAREKFDLLVLPGIEVTNNKVGFHILDLIDASEIANRDDLFSMVGLSKLPFLANSDLHEKKHIYSWKTQVFASKDPESIKKGINVKFQIAGVFAILPLPNWPGKRA